MKTLQTQFASEDELRAVLNAIHDNIHGHKRTLNITEHQALSAAYERFHELLPPPPKPELTPEQEETEMIAMQQEAMAAQGEAELEAEEHKAMLTTPFFTSEDAKKPIKAKSRRCKKCGTSKTYIYKGRPRWHFVGHDTYCHKCYSKMFRHKK